MRWVLVLLLLAGPAHCLRFAHNFGSHMVLQRDKPNILWGYADSASAKVSVSVDSGSAMNADVLDGNIWRVVIPAFQGGNKAHEIIAKDDQGHNVTLTDVLFGEVWVCSGQSNMAFLVENAFNGSALVQDANNWPFIRLFTSKKIKSSSRLPEQPEVEEPWAIANNVSISQDAKEESNDDNWLYMSAVCWLYGREIHQALGVPVGLLNTNWGGTPIELWSSSSAMGECGGGPDGAGYDGMITPLLNTTIAGAIWYQGEANAAAFDKYSCQFPAMIKDWRHQWSVGTNGLTDPTFPFGFVQLAAWLANDTQVAGLRWAQTADVGSVPNKMMPNTFMAVAYDLGDASSPYGSVHSRHKQEVGVRLGRAGLAVAYNHSISWTGPIATTAKSSSDGSVTVSFTNTGPNGVVLNNSTLGWRLCDEHDGCHAAVAHVVHAAELSVVVADPQNSGVSFATVDYAWSAFPCDYLSCGVYSSNTLPLPPPPFRLSVE